MYKIESCSGRHTYNIASTCAHSSFIHSYINPQDEVYLVNWKLYVGSFFDIIFTLFCWYAHVYYVLEWSQEGIHKIENIVWRCLHLRQTEAFDEETFYEKPMIS